MGSIGLAVGIAVGIAVLAGALLSIASLVFAVPRDEKTEALREVLPGANCGACGYSGCDGYARAMAHEGAEAGLCAPGGEAVAKACGELLGVTARTTPMVSVVRCGGCDRLSSKKLTYEGVRSCAAASAFFGGDKSCAFGCLGYGDCAAACPSGAIRIVNGIASVDARACTGCGLCVKACPKQVLAVRPKKPAALVACTSTENGAAVRKVCQKGCLGCMKCQKVCPAGAIRVENRLAAVDAEKCTACGECAKVCPQAAIVLGGLTAFGE